jgi:ParB/RepB/Spo0J family partition protein
MTEAVKERLCVTIPVDQLEPNPWNKRRWCKRDKDDADLCALRDSIERVGSNFQRVVVRPLADIPDRYQIVAGERRCRAIGLSKKVRAVYCEVYELTDEQAFEIAMAENARRKNLEPIEEADTIQAWLGIRPEWTLDDAAAHMGISRATAARRVQLAMLTPLWRQALNDFDHWASKWGAALLGRVAALPPETQDRLLAYLDDQSSDYYTSPSLSLLKTIIGKLTRSLDRALFSLSDGAHPCVKCPKRASCQPELWTEADMSGADDDYEDDDCDTDRAAQAAQGNTCLDGQCYDAKMGAAQKARIVELNAQHPNLVVLLAYGDKPAPWMGTTGMYYDYDKCKKGAPGAVPTVKLDNLGGKVQWMSTGPSGASGKKAATKDTDGKNVAQSLTEKRAKLDKLRWRMAVVDIYQTLDGMCNQPDTLPQMDVAKIVALADIGGTSHRHGHDLCGNHDFWKNVDKACLNSARPLDNLYLDSVKVVVSRLKSMGNSSDFDQYCETEARGACNFFRLDVDEYWQRAVDAKPEPKSWSKAGK